MDEPVTCCVHGDRDRCRGRIRRRIMHRVTRHVNKTYPDPVATHIQVHNSWSDLKEIVQHAITEVLEEEIS